MVMVMRLLLGQNHLLGQIIGCGGWQAVKANSPRLKTTPFHARFVRIADLGILEEDAFILHQANTTAKQTMEIWGMTARGGCLCGVVEFEVDLPFVKFVKCHCSRCRRATGSAFAANAYVLPEALRWLSGQDQVMRFDLPQARSFATSFCVKCGSPLPHATRSGREVIIPAGSLLNDPGASPTIDACWQSRARWLSDAINLPTSD
jgi:hypothetical protein